MSKIISLILIAFAVSASARNFHITNNCGFDLTVTSPTSRGPSPINGGYGFGPGQSADIGADDNWAGNFNAGSPGSLAEFSLQGWGGQDFYDISLVDGFFIAIRIAPDNGCNTLTCWGSPCDQGYNYWNDDTKTNGCGGSPNYSITYCP